MQIKSSLLLLIVIFVQLCNKLNNFSINYIKNTAMISMISSTYGQQNSQSNSASFRALPSDEETCDVQNVFYTGSSDTVFIFINVKNKMSCGEGNSLVDNRDANIPTEIVIDKNSCLFPISVNSDSDKWKNPEVMQNAKNRFKSSSFQLQPIDTAFGTESYICYSSSFSHGLAFYNVNTSIYCEGQGNSNIKLMLLPDYDKSNVDNNNDILVFLRIQRFLETSVESLGCVFDFNTEGIIKKSVFVCVAMSAEVREFESAINCEEALNSNPLSDNPNVDLTSVGIGEGERFLLTVRGCSDSNSSSLKSNVVYSFYTHGSDYLTVQVLVVKATGNANPWHQVSISVSDVGMCLYNLFSNGVSDTSDQESWGTYIHPSINMFLSYGVFYALLDIVMG